MIDKSELLRVPAFTDLPEEQIAWFLSQSQETHVKAGETYVRQGDPADWMFVILEGQFQWRGEFGGETVVLSAKVGDVTGVLPFSRMKQFTVTGRTSSYHRRPSSEISRSAISRSRAEDAGVDHAPGRSDVRPDPRSHSHRTAARPASVSGKTFSGTSA